jgi:hypothetical protein
VLCVDWRTYSACSHSRSHTVSRFPVLSNPILTHTPSPSPSHVPSPGHSPPPGGDLVYVLAEVFSRIFPLFCTYYNASAPATIMQYNEVQREFVRKLRASLAAGLRLNMGLDMSALL